MSLLIKGIEMPADDMKNIMILADGRVFKFSGYGNPEPLGTAIPVENTSKAYQMMAEAYEAEVTKPSWIPVTERLPEEGQVVCVSDGKNTWDYGTFRGLFIENGNTTMWYWKKRTIKEVKWWMLKSDALPEPPKEE